MQNTFLTGIEAPRVAVFVDGENIEQGFEPALRRALMGKGRQVVRRVYGNEAHISAWDAQSTFSVRKTCVGKNSADMQISVDAMDLSYRGLADQFVFVTTDVDFVAVVENLRERGFPVTGIGKANANIRLKRAYCDFIVLEEPVAQKARVDWEQDLREMIAGHGNGMPIVELNSAMRSLHNINISEQPEGTWRKYLEARSAVFRCDPKGPDARVRVCKGAL